MKWCYCCAYTQTNERECVIVGDGVANKRIQPLLVRGDRLIKRAQKKFLHPRKAAKVMLHGRRLHKQARGVGQHFVHRCVQVSKQSTVVFVESLGFVVVCGIMVS